MDKRPGKHAAWHFAAAALATIALASCSKKNEATRSSPPSPIGPTYPLAFQVQSQFSKTYTLHRVWKADPPGSGNGNYIQDFTPCVTEFKPVIDAAHGNDFSDVVIAVTKVGGKNPGFNVRQMTPEIEKTKMLRKFTQNGAQPGWSFEGFGNSGYSGMMTSKAIGLYEVGFLELSYPKDPVPIGGTWTALVHVGNEAYDGQYVTDVRGNEATCTYRLEAVDAAKHTAEISFSLDASISATTVSPPGAAEKLALHDSGKGKWIIDTKSGLPISFESSRTAQSTTRGVTQN